MDKLVGSGRIRFHERNPENDLFQKDGTSQENLAIETRRYDWEQIQLLHTVRGRTRSG